jgi:hypothetical protein
MSRLGSRTVNYLSWLALPSVILLGILASIALDTSNLNYDITLGLAIFILPIFFAPAFVVSWAGSALAGQWWPASRFIDTSNVGQ